MQRLLCETRVDLEQSLDGTGDGRRVMSPEHTEAAVELVNAASCTPGHSSSSLRRTSGVIDRFRVTVSPAT